MTKSDLVEQIASRAGISKTEAGGALEATLAAIEDGLTRGDDITITGFGKFSVAHRGPRQGVNPATGERIKIGASKAPRFSPGSRLKEAVKA